MTRSLNFFRDSSCLVNKDQKPIYVWFKFGSIMPNHLNMPKTQILDNILTASGLLDLNSNFYQGWTENDWVMSKKPYSAICTKFGRFQPINWSNINIF